MSYHDSSYQCEQAVATSVVRNVKAYRVYLDSGHEFTMLARKEADVHASHSFYGISLVREIALTPALIDDVIFIGEHHLPLAV